MHDALGLILQRAECDPPIFHADDMDTWPAGEMSRWTDLGILRPAAPAESMPCAACGGDHVEDVVFLKGHAESEVHAYLPCPIYGPERIPLDRLRRWEVDTPAILRAASSSAAWAVHEIVPGRLWRMGRARWDGRPRDIYVGRMCHRQDYSSLMVQAGVGHAAIVFAPCHVPNASDRDRMPLILSLQSSLLWQDGHLCVDEEYVETRLTERRSSVESAKKRPVSKRANRAAGIAALTDELIRHIRAARDYAIATQDRHGEARLLPRPTQEELAARAGVSQWTVSRCLHDDSARELRFLWELAVDVDRILGYSERVLCS